MLLGQIFTKNLIYRYRSYPFTLIFCSFLILNGCASEENKTQSSASTYSIKTTVSGLNGTLILSSGKGSGNVYDSSEAIAVTEDGDYAFTGVEGGSDYTISILQQPIAQTCLVNEASGILNSDKSITVNCEANATVGGSVSGLVGSVTLVKNSNEELSVSSNGQFNFENPVNIGDSYLVTAKDSKSSTGQICSASNNKGVVTGNVENIQITCSSIVRTISGSINNLSGTLILQNNFGGDQTFSENSNFTFFVADGAQFQVRVKSQPKGKCVVRNGNGTANANVSNVSVNCWSLVDGGSSSSGINVNQLKNAEDVSLQSFQSKLYAGWTETSSYGSVSQVRVKRFDNGSNSWERADYSGIPMDGSKDSKQITLLDNGTHLYGTWTENDFASGTPLIRVGQFDNTTLTWTKYISSYQSLSDNASSSPALEMFNSSIFSIWTESNGSKNQIRVKKFNGINSWSVDKASLNDNQSQDALNPTMEEFNNKLFAIWQESNGTALQIRVASTDGSNWGNSTAINLSSTKDGSNPNFITFDSKLFAAWSETNSSGQSQIRIKASSNGTSWIAVDGNDPQKGLNKDYRHNASHPKLVVANSNLYAVWLEENGSTQVRVAQFDNSSSWTFKDGDGFEGLNVNTARVTGKASAAEYNNQLYVAWSETNDNNTTQIRVVRAPF